MMQNMSFEDRLAWAKRQAGQKVEKKTQDLQTTISSTKRKILETREMIQSYNAKIERLSKQRDDLIRKNENRLKYLEDLSR